MALDTAARNSAGRNEANEEAAVIHRFFPRNAIGWLLLICGVAYAIVVRVRLLGIPLERDEGEYAYVGQLMLQGIPPYKLAYTMKLPGTHATYAVIMGIFGQTIAGIHIGLLLINAATIVLLFLLGRRLLNVLAGGAAAASYAVMSGSPAVHGFAGHATHFVMLPVVGGALLLLRALDRPSSSKALFVSGALFGVALLMKQPALFFIPFGAGYLFYRDYRASRSLKNALFRNVLFCCGAILPLAMTCFLFWRAGVFEKFWFWTVDYAREYGRLRSFSQGAWAFCKNVSPLIGSFWPLWVGAGIGLSASLRDLKSCASAAFVVGFLGSSALALCPGLYFREHYFILLLPALSLLAGVAVVKATDLCASRVRLVRFVPLLLFGAALVFPLYARRVFLFEASPVAASRMAYGGNPFPESVRIAEYLREHTNPEDAIAVVGSEPQIYFYSSRHSATGYIYTYGLMERHKYALQMQREMIHEIESARPKYLVFVDVQTSWLSQSGSEQLILTWFNDYSSKSYTAAGVVNILSLDQTDYYFQDSLGTVPLAFCNLVIYKRDGS